MENPRESKYFGAIMYELLGTAFIVYAMFVC